MVRLAAVLYLLLTALLVPVGSEAQQPGDASLRVRIRDAETRQPIAGAHITFPDLGRFWVTDERGVATATGLPAGENRIEMTSPGHFPARVVLDIRASASAEADFQLLSQPIEVAGVTVTARSRTGPGTHARWSSVLDRIGFYDRTRSGFGYHFDRAALEERNPVLLTDVLRGIPSVRLPGQGFDIGGSSPIALRRAGPIFQELQASGPSRGPRSGGCVVDLYVDGLPWQGDIDYLPVASVEGVEVYPRSNQAPIRYSSTRNGCGAVLVWTGRW